MQTTIFALSSAPGRSGIAVIRVSGPQAAQALNAMTGRVPAPRRAHLCVLRDPESGASLDQALVLWFPAPRSFTGEDVAEFHIHGGRAVIDAVLQAIGRVPETRMAEAGEFARRAFENGKLDLTAAEGLADLIDAETETQRRQALRQSTGALARKYESWREAIILALAEIEADLDFSDEADVSRGLKRAAHEQMVRLEADIRSHLDDGRRGEILRSGFHVAIAGPVNAGKSSLLNALAQRDAAIVSDKPGTTRDIVEVRLDLGGYPVLVSDTAGLRNSREEVEAEGIRRAIARACEADMVVWLADGAGDRGARPPSEMTDCGSIIFVVNKCDLLRDYDIDASQADLFISVHTGQGLTELVSRIAVEAAARVGGEEQAPLTQERHRRELACAADALSRFTEATEGDVELRCEDLRQAAACLGRITGRIDVEEVLDHVFTQFCIGK
jgi:tRNA modification GTPase